MINLSRQFNKTRIAPTPSGYLHLGNILSFALTAALAKKSGAKILLRVDDLDRERVQPHFVQDIFDTLNFMEIPWDEGPHDFADYQKNWSQIYRMGVYENALQQLNNNETVFACNCSRAQIKRVNNGDIYPGTCFDKSIPLDAANASWRLKTDDSFVKIKTLAASVTTILTDDMQYFTVRKKDGYPAYQLTSILDDIYFGIDLIVRGADLWPSTIAQHYLAKVLGLTDFQQITFYHHPLLMADENEKLSKSAGATSVNYLRSEGKKPADIYQMIADMAGISSAVSNWRQLADEFFSIAL